MLPAPDVKRRPRDRKRMIENAAAEAFAAAGYHNVSMHDVAGAVGISAPALYRHFPNKYALFACTAFALARRILEATDAVAAAPCETPEQARGMLDALFGALIAATIDMRSTGGIYRWEGRYLKPDDRAELTAEFSALRERVARPLALWRGELSGQDVEALTWASLATVSSITAHRTVLSARALAQELQGAVWRILRADLPPFDGGDLRRAEQPPAASRRESISVQSIALFHRLGYNDTSIEEIGGAVGLTPSGVYRHFEGKPAILLDACTRAAATLEQASAAANSASASPPAALAALCDDYVRYGFVNYQLMGVYFADVRNLDEADQQRLRLMQREHVAVWTDLLMRSEPSLGRREAAVRVHAAFSIVLDLGLLLRHRTNDAASARISRMMQLVLGIA